ncbi:MarR family winged helix-turn-helix transcriptional regulator [Catenisphaera adipataccumulans]|uniref:DNA-binding MarR family transcriptional regulator n=1 Tax=Catenisphaera adipataccumulans TaxID=700500 RepID=A0A7W8FVX9_9FIRM|nr:MarR family transcriptional regulator [Catenisphaera adipataccumulans]MBB5182095.1 DNA-binding MarR family transcriptional regulator [Catenisphaera adipataccumulans]
MNTKTAKDLMQACQLAREITRLQPALPPGMTPLSIRMLEAIDDLSKQQEEVRGRDLSRLLHLSPPAVARTIKEMEKAGAVRKAASQKDQRGICFYLTEQGKNWLQYYVTDYYVHLSQVLHSIDEKDAQTAVQVIQVLYQAMKGDRYNE